MRVVSFNVNSVRIRLHQLQAVIDTHKPVFIGLQETKVQDADFPTPDINAMGYEVAYYGQKTHYGVALLYKKALHKSGPFKQTAPRIYYGLLADDEHSQRRFVAARFQLHGGQTLTLLNGYFPQGENRSHKIKFPMKSNYYADILKFLKKKCTAQSLALVMGDMNIAPMDVDIGIGESNRKRWLREGKTCFLPEERVWLQKISDWGLFDTFRCKYPKVNDQFSWFDYRSKGFEREPRRGLRIDLIMTTASLQQALVDSGIDYAIRAMEKPSDHCPVWAEFDLGSCSF